MPTIVHDCPRCGSKRGTFDVLAQIDVEARYGNASWQTNHEIYSRCRHCHVGTTFVLMLTEYAIIGRGISKDFWSSDVSLNDFFEVQTYISLKDASGVECPEHLPEEVEEAFLEAAACFSIACHNAACAMLRLSIELATKALIPTDSEPGGPSPKQRASLAGRLAWLFESGGLALDLKDLAGCIRENGNDSVHNGNLTHADAHDMLDFAVALLRRVYTEPERIALAKIRREERRQAS